jgi:hypothetical protein
LSAIPVAPVKAESDLELIASGAACSDHRPGFKGAPFARLNLEQFGTKAAGDTCVNFHHGFSGIGRIESIYFGRRHNRKCP